MIIIVNIIIIEIIWCKVYKINKMSILSLIKKKITILIWYLVNKIIKINEFIIVIKIIILIIIIVNH